MVRDPSVRCGVDADKNDVFLYRVTVKKFGSERDSDVSADGIRKPRIEELEREGSLAQSSLGRPQYISSAE
jgi:hypothetical protein